LSFVTSSPTKTGNPAPTNTPLALVQLLNYWKTNTAIQPNVAASQNTNYFQITFVYRPAEPGVTYHVQASSNLISWLDIASYAGSNIVLTAQAQEISKTGSPNETVTIRDATAMNSKPARFLRVNITRP